MKTGFSERGIAKLDRLNQDETQALCTQYATGAIPKDVAAKIEKANMASIRPPSDGKYLGDWKRGEQIAQRGTGFQYSDTKDTPVGGNCYACHQLTKAEISYGTMGPSLYNFGKIRGFTPEMQQYAWGKVWNTQAFSACSFMPRFPAWMPLHEWFPAFLMPTGNCTDDVWSWLGLSMAQWTQLIFAAYVLVLAVVVAARLVARRARA